MYLIYILRIKVVISRMVVVKKAFWLRVKRMLVKKRRGRKKDNNVFSLSICILMTHVYYSGIIATLRVVGTVAM